MPVSRRSFLSRASLLAAAGLGGPAVVQGAEVATRRGERPKRIIHLVADGMSAGTLSCADYLSQQVRGRGLTWTSLMQQPGASTALVNMRSLNSMVTDSSAASSSWGSGSRIVNGQINVLPDGRALKTLGELFGDIGWKRALVTTTEITHATPAGFAASGLGREAGEDVAAQYLDRRIDVLLGGGSKHFDPVKRKDQRNLLGEFQASGYRVLRTAQELAAAPAEARWLGLFYPTHLPFTLDHQADAKLRLEVPTLAVMTRAALRRLERDDQFLMQVEGGRVDHGCHSCDAAAAFRDMIAFDEALDVCLDYRKRHPQTLLVVTTDHGNGNPGVNGAGTAYGSSSKLFANLKDVRRSFEAMDALLKQAKSTAELRQLIHDSTGYKVPDEKVELFEPFLHKKGKALYDLVGSVSYQLGQLLANHIGVGWASGSHTSDFVPLLAVGPGAEKFRGFLANTDIFRNYLALAKIDFENPSLPLLAESGPSAGQVESVETAWA